MFLRISRLFCFENKRNEKKKRIIKSNLKRKKSKRKQIKSPIKGSYMLLILKIME
jgi:hypothetical protein